MKKISVLVMFLICSVTFLLTGCPPTQTHEETITIPPSNWNTLTDTDSGGDLCRGGLQPDQPGPNQIITGFFHRYDNDSGCWVNQIYEGLLRFQIDAAPFYKRLIKTATLNLHTAQTNANPSRSTCINKLGLTDIQWWALPNTGRIHVSDLRNLQTISPAVDLKVDVTPIVQRWANGTDINNGFIFIGQRPELSDFSNDGMLTNETCESFYNSMSLTVTFFQFNNEPHHPSITVSAVRTQTTTDITVDGTDFTPNGSAQIFADGVPGRMGSFPLGNTSVDSNGKFQFFYRSLCTRQTDSATIRALDNPSGDNARSQASVFCN